MDMSGNIASLTAHRGAGRLHGMSLELQQFLLVCVLVVATAYRFYLVDSAGLWSVELTNASTVLHTGWVDMVSSMVNGSTEPPGYVTVLYWASQWFGHSAFALRLPSVLAGIGAVMMLFLLGKKLYSPSAGLLAAAMIAGSSQMVMFSQEAQVSALLTLFVLISIHCFLSIFSTVKQSHAQEFRMEFKSLSGNFSFLWRLAVAAPPGCLIMFWASGIFLLYLSYFGSMVLAIEFFLALLLVSNKPDSGRLLSAVFLPVLFPFIFWLPAVVAHIEKMKHQINFSNLEFSNVAAMGDAWLSQILVLKMILLSLVCLAFFQVLMSFLRSRLKGEMPVFFLFTIFLSLLTFLLTSFLSLAGHPGLYLALQPFFLLISAVALCRIIDAVPFLLVRNTLAFFLVMGVMVLQFEHNRSKVFFSEYRKPDIRPAIRMIAKDRSFMESIDRHVFVSLDVINHYLDRFGITVSATSFAVNAQKLEDVRKVDAYALQRNFYYVGIIDRPEMIKPSPFLEAMQAKYGVLCKSGFSHARLVKFSMNLPVSADAAVPDCREGNVSLAHSTVADRMQGLR